MEHLVDSDIEEYCEAHSDSEGELLYRLFRETNLKAVKPRMLSGALQGRFLSFLIKLVHPINALELGTYTGYSALSIAEGLANNGVLHTIEAEEELEEMILRYFNASPYRDKIHLHIGEAAKLIPQFDCRWDFVFIDADKRSNQLYYDLLVPRMNKGGIILIDNVLWSGKVVEEQTHSDIDTQAVMAFNDYVQQDARVSNVMLPLRDGMMMVRVL